ncbi:hypothetical protein TanjilG_03159 [Lupinus angustifolius]|uniref:Uncharacterized protein n=1 Tax=Lupinus angustifolius TaxID=3871 RepID=A0A4P1RD91_LUPAN|nr:hypothetical protein TanjilG_03159 [Lupinus angustifolius]
MRIVRGMQRSFCENLKKVLCWNKYSFIEQGIGIAVPKARTRDKPIGAPLVVLRERDEENEEKVTRVVVSEDVCDSGDFNKAKSDGLSTGNLHFQQNDGSCDDEVVVVEKDVKEENVVKVLSRLRIASENEGTSVGSSSLASGSGSSCPPPPPVPPPKPSTANINARRNVIGASNSGSVGPSRRASVWPVVLAGSRPSSPRSHNESEGYDSADEQLCYVSSYDDRKESSKFEINIRRAKGYEALLAEGQFYSDLELTEKDIDRMVMAVSRAEYLANGTFKQQLSDRESSTSNAEPSSSGAKPREVAKSIELKMQNGVKLDHFEKFPPSFCCRIKVHYSQLYMYIANYALMSATGSSGTDPKMEDQKGHGCDISSSMQIALSMGFSYLQAIEAYSIYGDDVDSMLCYLLETSNTSRRKGKATE